MEGLSQRWGLYLVAAVDTNRVGVSDMQAAMSAVSNYPGWTADLRNHTTDERVNLETSNRAIATKVLMKMLAARVVVFELFLEAAVKMDGQLQKKHQHDWLLFQLSDVLDRTERAQRHPFLQVNTDCLGGATPDALEMLVARIDAIMAKYLPRDPHLYFVVDEAQAAAESSPHAFTSSNGGAISQSMFREVIRVYANVNPIIKFVVSGTGLSLEIVNEVIASGVGKPSTSGGFHLFHDVGSFDTKESQRAYLDRYVPHSVLESSSGRILCKRIHAWLAGR
jgi:hypothetical protein